MSSELLLWGSHARPPSTTLPLGGALTFLRETLLSITRGGEGRQDEKENYESQEAEAVTGDDERVT